MDYSDGGENFFAGQGHRQIIPAYLTASGPAATRPAAVTGPVATGSASAGSRVRAASARSFGRVRIVNGVREEIPAPPTQPKAASNKNTASPRQAPRGLQRVLAGPSPLTPATTTQPSRGPKQPATASATASRAQLSVPAPRAPSQTSHASSGGNSGRSSSSRGRNTTPATGPTVDAIIEAEIHDLITAAKNGILGNKFLPLTDKGDAPQTARLRLFITEAAFRSNQPTDSMAQKGWLDIFHAARKYLVDMTFELIKRDNAQLIEHHWEAFQRFGFKNGLYAAAVKALECASNSKNAVASMRDRYKGENQLDVIDKALEVNGSAHAHAVLALETATKGSDDGETPNDSRAHDQFMTDMSIKVTTTIEQTEEHLDETMIDAQPYGITTTIIGPGSTAVETGSILFASRVRGGDLTTFSERPINILPAGIHASIRLEGDDADLLRHHMRNPECLIEALQAIAFVLRGDNGMTTDRLESIWADHAAESAQVEAEREATQTSSMDPVLEDDEEL